MQALCGYRASRMLLFCVDFNRICDTAAYLDCSFHAGEPVSFVTGVIDTALAAQTAAIAARSLGIDVFFTNGVHRGDIRRIYEILDLPERVCFPVVALLLGYPAQEPAFQKGRLSSQVIHHGRYRRLSSEDADRLVATYDDPERHLGLISDWREKGYEHYLEWFYKDWSGPIDAGHFCEILGRACFLGRAASDRT